VPGIIALLLIAGSFILGHWTQTLHQEATAGDGTAAAPQIEVQSRHLRRLAVQKQQNTQVQKLALPDPLDTAALERFMLESSGILKVRPPIPAGRSGEDFLRVIPFQILSWAPRWACRNVSEVSLEVSKPCKLIKTLCLLPGWWSSQLSLTRHAVKPSCALPTSKGQRVAG
jgi:hypothetical protein